jgi:CheY-like chemotaxis protein
VTPGAEGADVVLDVTDDGPGIAADERARVFEPFARGAHGGDRPGTGLGLPLARQLARAMHGDLVLVPSEHGAHFRATLRLPCVPAVAASQRRTWTATRSTRSLRVLLAVDDFVNRIIARRVLERMGHEVEVVCDGTSALGALCRDSYDLAILDIEMPGASGLDVVRNLRDREIATPVVGFTAHESPAQRVCCLDAGMVDVLLKPVDAEQFGDAVSRNGGCGLRR